MLKNKISALIMGVSLALAGGAVHSGTVAADGGVPEYRLQISPAQNNLGELQPGETYTGTFRVQNTGQKPYQYNTEVTPYSVQGEKYEPLFNTTNQYTLMQDWVTIDGGEGEVQPGEETEVKYTIEVPRDAPAGNQNAAIAVTMLDDSVASESGIKTIQQASFIMFSNIAGETRETAEIVNNKVPSFLFAPPVTASSVVKNTGNVYTVAEYTLDVKSFFGGKDVFTTPEEDRKEIIFPDTERYNEVSWEGAPQIGLFKVKQTVKIFDEVSEVEKVVFLCPLWFLILIIAIIGVIIFWIVSRILKRKSA